MSKVKPVIIAPPDAVGLDKVVKEINTLISQTKFINDSGAEELYFDRGLLLPIAELDEQKQKPVVYWKDKEYFPATPNDNYRVVSHFYQTDPNSAAGQDGSTYDLHLVIWFNQDKYIQNKNYSIKEFFIEQLRVRLRNYLRLENKASILVFRETDSVFARYELGNDTKMKLPYQAFRINFKVTAPYDCGENLLNLST